MFKNTVSTLKDLTVLQEIQEYMKNTEKYQKSASILS